MFLTVFMSLSDHQPGLGLALAGLIGDWRIVLINWQSQTASVFDKYLKSMKDTVPLEFPF